MSPVLRVKCWKHLCWGLLCSASAHAADIAPGSQTAAPAVGLQQAAVAAVQARLDGAQQAWASMLSDAGLVYQPIEVMVLPAEPTEAKKKPVTNRAAPAAVKAEPALCPPQNDWGGLRYCPPERKIMMDMRYLDQWAQQASSVGDDVRAYVLAHVLAHHVQNLLGVTEKLSQWQVGHSRRWRQDMHLRVELQADCLAGVWFQRTASGEDWRDRQRVSATMQRVAHWHHDDVKGGGEHVGSMLRVGGTSLHVRWFQRGLDAAGVEDCDTFIDESL